MEDVIYYNELYDLYGKLLTDKHQLNEEQTILVKSNKTDAVLNVVKTEKWVKR